MGHFGLVAGLVVVIRPEAATAALPVCSIDAHTPQAIELARVEIPTGGYVASFEITAVAASTCTDQVTVLRTGARLQAHQNAFLPTTMDDEETIDADRSEGFAVAGVPGCPTGRTEWSNQGEVQWLDYETGSQGGPRNDTSGRLTTVCSDIPIRPVPDVPRPPGA